MSLQTKNKERKRKWTSAVRKQARARLTGSQFPLLDDVAVAITYFYEDPPLDLDNMIKPILDGLWPEIVLDDRQVRDVSGSRRQLGPQMAFRDPSATLLEALSWNVPFVYVQIGVPIDEEEVLWIGMR